MIIKTASLTPNAYAVIKEKDTERPFTGEYDEFDEAGSYLCRQCGLALFRSQTKFHSQCGWPSFDEEIKGAVKRERDPDNSRIEILCARCDAHLGHVFSGEGFTAKNLRHCVNSLSLDFVKDMKVLDSEEAIVAAGCFWGVEHYFKQLPGVLKTEVGYTGGRTPNPTYEAICAGDTGHFEALRILYDLTKIDYANIIKYFFEIHDPTQTNGQGPDLGEQYLSKIFYYDENQKKIAADLIQELMNKGYAIATTLREVSPFWVAENYHQNYYQKTGKQPYCHHYTKRF